jgi:hypothetical protein
MQQSELEFVRDNTSKEIQDYLDMLYNNQIVDWVDPELFMDINNSIAREMFTQLIGYVLPTMQLARDIKEHIVQDGSVLEIMAGSGIMANYLHVTGINIIATDDFSWHGNNPNYRTQYWNKMFFDVQKYDALHAIEKFGKDMDYVLMIWPPYNDPIAYRSIKKLHDINPDSELIFIGEGSDGCTADRQFYENVQPLGHYSYEKINQHFINWFGIHDYVSIYKWKEA